MKKIKMKWYKQFRYVGKPQNILGLSTFVLIQPQKFFKIYFYIAVCFVPISIYQIRFCQISPARFIPHMYMHSDVRRFAEQLSGTTLHKQRKIQIKKSKKSWSGIINSFIQVSLGTSMDYPRLYQYSIRRSKYRYLH